MPCSPILVSRPHGSRATKPAWATARACSICSSVASGAPNVTFSRTLTENRVGSSNPQPTRVRSTGSGRSRMSVPFTVIDPAVGSASRGTSCSSVVLPDPVAPVSARVWPGSRSSDTPRSTGRSVPG